MTVKTMINLALNLRKLNLKDKENLVILETKWMEWEVQKTTALMMRKTVMKVMILQNFQVKLR
jgi:hypothetical protein